MKTKSFLFAALLTVSFATTSCQKEESITPAGIDQFSMGTSVPSRKLITDNMEVVADEQDNTPKPQATKDSVVIIKIAKINSDDTK
jgi:hypothetical protein